MVSCQFQIFQEFVFISVQPIKYQFQSPSRHTPRYLLTFDSYRHLVILIFGMKTGRSMIVVIHENDYPAKPRNFWHN